MHREAAVFASRFTFRRGRAHPAAVADHNHVEGHHDPTTESPQDPPAVGGAAGHPDKAHTPEGPPRRARSAVLLTVVLLGGLTTLAVIAFWPRDTNSPSSGYGPREDVAYVNATVVAAIPDAACDPGDANSATALCTRLAARVTSGLHEGDLVGFSFSATEAVIPDLKTGDKVILMEFADADPEFRYYFYEYQRTWPLAWLGAVFVAAVVAFGGWQGLRALGGLVLSLAVLALFIVPALLEGSPALVVALAGAAAVAFLAVYLAHGFNLTSSIALVGTLVSLAATAALALLMASLAQISGLATEQGGVLRATSSSLDLRGLLVAGIVIGALGVLDDVTVSQVSTVAALRRANPRLSPVRLYGEAIRVGRDHVAAAVNTLVLAYAGASLPLLLFFAQGTTPLVRVATGELVAVEVIRMLVGSIGLILSVPVTTGLAVIVLNESGETAAGIESAEGR